MINPYKKYSYEVRDQSSKCNYFNTLTCLYCCKKGHTIKKCHFRRFLVPQGIFQWLPKCNLCTTHTHKDPIKIGYLLPLFKFAGGMLETTEKRWFLDSGC